MPRPARKCRLFADSDFFAALVLLTNALNSTRAVMKLTRWQKTKASVFLFIMGVKRRITFGVRVALIDGEKIFLIRHTYMPGWQLPGGGVEPGETAAFSAAREVAEETGFRVTGPLELFALYHNVVVTDRDHVALYLCRQFEKTTEFKPNYEVAEIGWFHFDALPDGTTKGTRQRVDEIFKGAAVNTTWAGDQL